MKILVTGSNGQLGSELRQLSKGMEASFHFTDADSLDITQADQVMDVVKSGKFDYCINCAAYTLVDKAEEESNLAEAVNVGGVRNLADACKELEHTTLIQVSSDYVYHNDVNRPMLEMDPSTPKGIYAQTKLKGDFAALTHQQSIVLRTSWVYSTYGSNFVKTMLQKGKEREALNVVYDQIGTPTYARDLARAILHIIAQCDAGQPEYGIFNFSNEGVTSWYDLALEIFGHTGMECRVNPILSKEYPTAAPRPNYSVLDKSKIKAKYKLAIPHWKASLRECLDGLSES